MSTLPRWEPQRPCLKLGDCPPGRIVRVSAIGEVLTPWGMCCLFHL